MNAVPSQLLQQAEQLSADVTRPIPGSHKIHVQGWYRDNGFAPPFNANFTHGIGPITVLP